MIWLVAYDISHPKRLRKFAIYCEKFGVRLQKSIFQIDADKEMINNFMKGVPDIIKKRQDSVIVYPLCDDCRRLSMFDGPNNIIDPNKAVIL